MKPYDFKQVEQDVLALWKERDVYGKSRKKNAQGKKYYFLQGPPYTSGRLHMGQAWNNALKDVAMRFRRLNGYDVWDRAGYDMHGLPTERKVMELHKIKAKEDIEKFGVEKFSQECMDWAKEKANVMNDDLLRLGVWMDYSDPYMPITNEFMEGEWYLIKRAHEQGRLYEGDRTLTWCPNCATAMAKHECTYKNVTDESIFLKFKVKSSKDEFLIIWTTTPWTIMFNLAIMVNPDIEYIKAKVGDEKWIVAKTLANVFIGAVAGKSYEVLEEFKGDKLEALEYEHPWNDDLPFYKELKKKHPAVHTVVMSSEYVDTSAGSGLVHCAPGCGPEDFEVGYKNNLPPFNNLDEHGVFPAKAGKFAGLTAKRDDRKFIEDLKKQGSLIAVTEVDHEYPHCERCKTPAIFRKTKQWFFKVEDLKEQMLKANQDICWVPKSAQNAFNSWLDNLRDNSISKQRHWGTPIPIWKCEKCSTYDVIGSIAELKTKAKKVPDNIHKPWIDQVTYKCECGSTKKRVSDILDVWIDAGTTSWTCLYYPQRTDLLERYDIPDFILEGKDQIRGWFNMLMVASYLAFGRPAFKSVYMHGFLTDYQGEKMSKSLGNIISPYEIVEKYGADTLRYYTSETPPGSDLNFSWEDVKFKHKNLQVLWNVQNYLLDLTRTQGIRIGPVTNPGVEEKYILSRVHSTIRSVKQMHESYRLDEIPHTLESLWLDISRDYIQFIREKEDKQLVADTLFEALHLTVRALSCNLPFITESIYQNLAKEYGLESESIHLLDWPEHDESKISASLEEEMRSTKRIVTEILSKREQAGIGVRWPLARAEILLENPSVISRTEPLIMQQTNIKKLLVKKGEFKVELDTVMSPALEQEGFARELARRVQALRKKAGLTKTDRINLAIEADFALEPKLLFELKHKVGAEQLMISKQAVHDAEFSEDVKIKEKAFKILMSKIYQKS